MYQHDKHIIALVFIIPMQIFCHQQTSMKIDAFCQPREFIKRHRKFICSLLTIASLALLSLSCAYLPFTASYIGILVSVISLVALVINCLRSYYGWKWLSRCLSNSQQYFQLPPPKTTPSPPPIIEREIPTNLVSALSLLEETNHQQFCSLFSLYTNPDRNMILHNTWGQHFYLKKRTSQDKHVLYLNIAPEASNIIAEHRQNPNCSLLINPISIESVEENRGLIHNTTVTRKLRRAVTPACWHQSLQQIHSSYDLTITPWKSSVCFLQQQYIRRSQPSPTPNALGQLLVPMLTDIDSLEQLHLLQSQLKTAYLSALKEAMDRQFNVIQMPLLHIINFSIPLHNHSPSTISEANPIIASYKLQTQISLSAFCQAVDELVHNNYPQRCTSNIIVNLMTDSIHAPITEYDIAPLYFV